MRDSTLSPRPQDAPAAASDWIRASQIIGEVERLTGQVPDIGVRRMLELAASSRIPLKMRRGRWGAFRDDLPAIATAMGLQLPQQGAAKLSPRSRKAASEHRATA